MKNHFDKVSGFRFFTWFTYFVILVPALFSQICFAQTTVTSGTTLTIASGASLVSLDDFVIANGANVDVAGTLILKENLTNNTVAADNLGTGTVEFSGSVAQNVTGQNIIQTLKSDNSSGGISLAGNTTVNSTLQLTNGLVLLNNYHLLLGPSAAITGTPAASNMIVTNGAGELRKEYPAGFTGSFTYPVGDNTSVNEYSPVTLNFSSATFAAGNYVGAKVVNSSYPGVSGSYLNRYWEITQSNVSDFSCSPAFNYVNADIVGTESDIYSYRVSPAPWVAFNPANTGANQIDISGIGSLSIFTGAQAYNGIVPPLNRSLQNYNTATGVTNCYDATAVLYIAGNGTTFTVENGGSVNLIAGERIFLLPGTSVASGGYLHGYITTTANYCGNPSPPIVQNPVLNSEQKQEIIAGNGSGPRFKVFPNPTTGLLTLEVSNVNQNQGIVMEIYGMRGDKIRHDDLMNTYHHEFSIEELPVGLYFIRVLSGNYIENIKILKH